MLADWKVRKFGENKAQTGAAHGMDRSDATKLINNYERKRPRI